MKTPKQPIHLLYVLRQGALGLICLTGPLASAQTLWTGPSTNYTQCVPDCVDQIIATVALNRGGNGPLYNSAPPYNESGPNGVTSPEDTLWAFLGAGQTISNYSSLSYQTFAAIRNNSSGNLGAAILNKPMVLQLINEQIYISIEFTAWGEHGAGGFTYTRSTAPVVVAPLKLSSPGITNGVFAFTYNVTPGQTYVVQESSNFTTWLPVATNIPSSTPALFTNALVPNATRYFRVDQVSSP